MFFHLPRICISFIYGTLLMPHTSHCPYYLANIFRVRTIRRLKQRIVLIFKHPILPGYRFIVSLLGAIRVWYYSSVFRRLSPFLPGRGKIAGTSATLRYTAALLRFAGKVIVLILTCIKGHLFKQQTF